MSAPRPPSRSSPSLDSRMNPDWSVYGRDLDLARVPGADLGELAWTSRATDTVFAVLDLLTRS